MSMIQLFMHASGSVVTEQEILEAIPKATLARIKERDPHPYFRAFVVAHEGVADPFFETSRGRIKKIVRVFRSTIESMARRIPGAKFFDDYHKKIDRQQIGTEVAFIQKEIDGNLHDIAIAYGDPSQRERLASKDIVSMEADVDVGEHQDGSLVLGLIKSIAAYATGKMSDGALPAWSGAKAVGALYAFSETKQNEDKNMSEISSGLQFQGQNGMRLPFPVTPDGFPDPVSTPYSHAENIVKSFLKAKTIRPSNVLSWEAIFGKREKGADGTTLWTGGDKEFRDRIIQHEKEITAPFEKEIERLKKFQDEAVQYRTKDFRNDLIKSARDEATKNKFDEKLTNILLKRLEKGSIQVDAQTMLLDEKERQSKLESLKADVIKNTIDDVRAEWQSSQPQKGAPQSAAGTVEQDYSGGTADDDEAW